MLQFNGAEETRLVSWMEFYGDGVVDVVVGDFVCVQQYCLLGGSLQFSSGDRKFLFFFTFRRFGVSHPSEARCGW